MALLARTRQRVPTAVRVAAGYVLAGAGLGGLWMWHSSEPLWQEAARLVILLAIVTVLSEIRHKRAAKAQQGSGPTPLRRFIIAKLALVVVAVIAALLLDHTTAHADVWVAVGLAVTVSVVGPAMHPWLTHAKHDETRRTGRRVEDRGRT